MITIERQDHNRYEVFRSDISIGYISVRCNPYHTQNYYLDLELTHYDPANAKELFKLLRAELTRPLQVMLYSWDVEKCVFLTSGGFKRNRQCYEMEVSKADLKFPLKESVPITKIGRGNSAYQVCCELLYNNYTESHKTINPLTADKELFCRALPDTVLFQQENGEILHFAFVEGNEIAYVGTTRRSAFHSFAQTMLFQMLAQNSSISFECDSCDPAAMELRAFFDAPNADSFDTYIIS